jgi:hypothetical protein
MNVLICRECAKVCELCAWFARITHLYVKSMKCVKKICTECADVCRECGTDICLECADACDTLC